MNQSEGQNIMFTYVDTISYSVPPPLLPYILM